ncbi:LytR/AlgR family response regulator transcription factor [Epilithonimonas hungarica]|jgi:Response regulator of the LytR/AlgR family|uniref:Two component transcriptional regulator, LytTR family n=1 Tax=Epilithonimonas hungarica TaxID=454006 RepID=A0A1G7FWZ3_9FLAO|nr:LytTR family DNA-binding domain-containing protein [Epilithonimonas hungarica]MDP9957058.1 two-component system LytT family response regulator [Epilithonimonas hungarica]SDE80416.1 two component transcriptional regulator, LytTR family [Epilithonimonas hungarica]
MITAILIDDDHNLRNGMRAMLSLYAPEIEILGEAESVKTGIQLIEKTNPQIVFLDIMMNDGSGFDILEKLNTKYGKISSHIVFVTAHEKFAIRAFRFSALDFLLKPIDPEDLQAVIRKIKNITHLDNGNKNIELLLENITRKTDNFKKIALSTSDGIHLFEVKDIIRCESVDNYTKFYIKNHNKVVMISKTLKEYEELLSDQGFERIHQSHLINLNEMRSYIKKDGGFVIMSDHAQLPVSQRKRDRLQDLISRF